MQNPYSEDQLVEQPSIALLAGMGWETLDCYNEFDQGISPLVRENKGEVVLTMRLRAALGAAQSLMRPMRQSTQQWRS